MRWYLNPIKTYRYWRRVRWFMKHWQFNREAPEIWAAKTNW